MGEMPTPIDWVLIAIVLGVLVAAVISAYREAIRRPERPKPCGVQTPTEHCSLPKGHSGPHASEQW